MNPRRIFTVATQVFWDVIRDRIFYLLILFVGLLAVVTRLLPEVSATLEDKISIDVSLAAINVFGLVIAIAISTALVNQEIERRTVYVLLAKPIRYSELIIGKHLGLCGVLAILIAVMTGASLLILSWNQVSYPAISLIISNGFLWLKLCLIAAVGILFGVFTSSLLATLLTFGVYLMGSLSRDLFNIGKLSQTPGLEQLTRAFYLVIPDLARLDLKNDAVYDQLPSPSLLLTNAGYGILYTIMVLCLAIAIFSQREF
ncbi:MAG: ABC transporter permease [Microcoleaceae cyanobacterium]